MIYFFWFAFVMIFACVICIGVFANDRALKKERNEQMRLNKLALEEARKTGFVPSRVFYIADYSTFKKPDECKKMLAVDTESKKILAMDYTAKTHYIIDFNEFLNYELYENASMVTEGVGGGIGVGYFGGETRGMVRDLRLIIRMKSIARPQVAYNLISKTILNMGVSKTSAVYRSISPTLQEIVSLLEVVKNENAQKASQ